MLSVVIPTLDVARTLPATLAPLVPAVVDGLIAEVIVADGGSTDATVTIADDAGCVVVRSDVRGRGPQLRAGAAVARKPWLLFLHADTVLEAGWHLEAAQLMAAVDTGSREPSAAAFRFALDEADSRAALIALGVRIRCRLFRLPFGDQGLLLPRSLYDRVGGYPAVPLMEDVALIRAIPRRQRVMLRSRAVTSAARYQADGYARRVLTNGFCLSLYMAGVAPSTIDRIYRRSSARRKDPSSPS